MIDKLSTPYYAGCLSGLVLFALLAMFASPPVCHGRENRNAAKGPDHEKHSCIQAVDGYAYLSEDMTLAQTRITAFANAKRQAVERARVYIQSKTKVKDARLEYDIVWSKAEGAVSVLEQKDLGVEENSRYHVWIKAEVTYGLRPQKSASARADVMDSDAPLTVRVWTDKKRYDAGDRITVFLQGNQAFYGRIVDITATGEIIQLLPNDFRGSAFFEPDRVYRIPDQEDRFELKVSPPYGEDRIVVYASEVPLADIAMEPIGHGLHRYRGTINDLAVKARGIKLVGKKGATDGAEFYETTWTVATQP